MANTRELRRRIKSVKNTSQITKAMQMVAATKMRRAQNQAMAGRPYTFTLSSSLSVLLPKLNDISHPLLTPKETGSIGVLLISTNKALCGALNTNLFRAAQQRFGDQKDIKYLSVGLKGRNFIVRTGKTLEADFENPETVIFREARQIGNLVRNMFMEGLLKEVYLVYPHFASTLRQEPRIVKLLPMDVDSAIASEKDRHSELGSESQSKGTLKPVQGDGNSEFLFEPNPSELLEFILIHNLETQIYQALLEMKASEHSARMMAMQNATDNAKELVEDLNLTYNQTRQSAITNELLEITTAAAAME